MSLPMTTRWRWSPLQKVLTGSLTEAQSQGDFRGHREWVLHAHAPHLFQTPSVPLSFKLRHLENTTHFAKLAFKNLNLKTHIYVKIAAISIPHSVSLFKSQQQIYNGYTQNLNTKCFRLPLIDTFYGRFILSGAYGQRSTRGRNIVFAATAVCLEQPHLKRLPDEPGSPCSTGSF